MKGEVTAIIAYSDERDRLAKQAMGWEPSVSLEAGLKPIMACFKQSLRA